MKMSMPHVNIPTTITSRNHSTKRPSQKSEKSLVRNKSGSHRSLASSIRNNSKSKNQVSYSNPRKQRQILNNAKRKYNFGSNESSRNKLKDTKTSEISSMIYKIGTKNAKKVNSSYNNPLSPKINSSFKQYLLSNEKQGLLRKNSKVMKNYYEGVK